MGTDYTEIFIICQIHRRHVRVRIQELSKVSLEWKNWDLEAGVPIRTCE